MSKQERYYSGAPLHEDPRRPVPGELTPEQRRTIRFILAVVSALGLGMLVGLWLAPEAPAAAEERIKELEEQLAKAHTHADQLMRTLSYRETDKPVAGGALPANVRKRHEEQGARYAKMLRALKAQGASEIMQWFLQRWNEILDHPQAEDRITRRAATLALLVGGMAENISPEDFVPWQASFFEQPWLGELHFDIDGDGLPAKRTAKNPKDGFANVSVCHIAMALNQAITDVQILMTPDMRCDRPESRMSMFLQGSTLNDAVNQFVAAIKQEGFLVVERHEKGERLILVGTGRSRERCPG